LFQMKQRKDPEEIKCNRTEKRKIGDLGENIACRFLMKRGFEIIEKNYLRKWGEIDIISKKGDKLHFIEVKSVSHLPYTSVKNDGNGYECDNYHPEDNLHPWKLRRLSRVIQTYLLSYRPASAKDYGEVREVDWQFDVIVVYLDIRNMQAKVDYLEDVIL